MLTSTLRNLPFQRPAVGYSATGSLTIKPLAKLPAPAREMVAAGGQTLTTVPFTTRPYTRKELASEEKSLRRQLRIVEHRLHQITQELNA
ncbi:hypothetical protein QMK33_19690 [Hymenobacter sp. H14-R3]|uniref:hypothetical protein n=1 Tax=Hymenobacter sp. H14-R3 TaxID=3046308 RepID=UPI0024B9E55B|nr:hypothetical protein [Hymenobacter sp. H14-R3]MDJ0367377.1 hypothetical protein [Hymenobacter sp. H14-R3]